MPIQHCEARGYRLSHWRRSSTRCCSKWLKRICHTPQSLRPRLCDTRSSSTYRSWLASRPDPTGPIYDRYPSSIDGAILEVLIFVVTIAPPAKDRRPTVCRPRPLCDCGCAESLAARDEFIGVLGHELRNSIAPLVLLTDHFEQLAPNDPHLKGRVAMLTRNLRKLST